MTETNEIKSRGDYSEGISIEVSKVIQGMSLVFAGATTMLEAIHPKISVEPAELMCLMTGDRDGLMKLAQIKKAEAEEQAQASDIAQAEAKEDAQDETKAAEVGATDVSADAPDDAVVPDPPADELAAPVEEAAENSAPTTTLTQDDITKVIVQKIKQNRSNNEKIGSVLKAYGATKVSDLPVFKYEAFLTDLSAI